MLYIIIPVHNRKEFTRECLLSLRQQTYKNFKVVIVDDGSTDGTYEMLKNEFPEIHVIKGDGNLWWAAATNLGIKYALENAAEYILTLNNDTKATKNYIEKMLFWSKKRPNSLLGSLGINEYTGEVEDGGSRINWLTGSTKKLINLLKDNEKNGLHKITHFGGRGLFIPVKVFDKIGLFNQKVFPHYAADYDFTFRAARAGFDIYINYDAKLIIFKDASGSENILKEYTWKGYIKHLTDIKGAGNLRNFIFYAFRNCPKIYLPSFLFIGLFRRLIGYPIRIILFKVKK